MGVGRPMAFGVRRRKAFSLDSVLLQGFNLNGQEGGFFRRGWLFQRRRGDVSIFAEKKYPNILVFQKNLALRVDMLRIKSKKISSVFFAFLLCSPPLQLVAIHQAPFSESGKKTFRGGGGGTRL